MSENRDAEIRALTAERDLANAKLELAQLRAAKANANGAGEGKPDDGPPSWEGKSYAQMTRDERVAFCESKRSWEGRKWSELTIDEQIAKNNARARGEVE